MHPGSPSDPSGTAATEAKPRCDYLILKPHGQSRSKAVVCVSRPRMYPRSGYFLVNVYNDNLRLSLGLATKYIIPRKYDIVSVLDEKNYE